MTEVYLLRHCEAYGNIYRRLDGVRDTEITEKGQIQINCVSKRFADIPVDAVFSSPLIRARKTAEGIAKAANAPHFCCDALHERSMGIFDGMSWYEAKEVYSEIFEQWLNDFDNFTIPSGESFNCAGERFQNAVFDICSRYPNGRIVIVAHSMVIKAFLQHVEKGLIQFGNNTAVSLLNVDSKNKQVEVSYLNDDSHLPGEMIQDRQRWAKRGYKLNDYSLRYNYPLENDGHSCRLLTPCFPFTIVGYESDRMVGYINVDPIGDISYIEELYIKPEFRRNGFATQLIGEAMYSSFRQGITLIRCRKNDHNHIIEKVAKRNGFIIDGSFYLRDIEMENFTSITGL